jgi:hypothetical protein
VYSGSSTTVFDSITCTGALARGTGTVDQFFIGTVSFGRGNVAATFDNVAISSTGAVGP